MAVDPLVFEQSPCLRGTAERVHWPVDSGYANAQAALRTHLHSGTEEAAVHGWRRQL